MKHNKKLSPNRMLICFDFCNTLVNSKTVDREIINETLERFNQSRWSIVRRHKDPEKSMKENFSNFFNEFADDAYKYYLERLIDNKDRIVFFDGALDLLHRLKKINANICVLSNRDKVFIEQVSQGRLANIPIFTPDDTKVTKPNSAFFHYVEDQLEEIPDIRIIVGDARADMELAERTNSKGIWFTAQKTDLTKIDHYSDVIAAENYQEISMEINKYTDF